MRVASNKLKDLSNFYYAELAGIYDANEIGALFALAAEYYLGYSRADLITKAESNINQSDLLKLYDCGKALKRGKPLQYILGHTWFYGLKFMVNESVLIPRPETEELVDLVVKENKTANSFLDIGTGSGCIPASIKTNLPNATVIACDISAAALELAKVNSKINKVAVIFFEANILNLQSFCSLLSGSVDVIISNPPYIKAAEKGSMSTHVLEHEPHLALFVEDADEIVFYKRIIDLCKERLNKNGKLYFELNPLTAEQVKGYAIGSGLFQQVNLLKDMSGKTRFLRAMRSKNPGL